MRLFITGGTGFIGTGLCQRLLEDGHELTVLTRQPPRPAASRVHYLAWSSPTWSTALAPCDAVINLAGESVATRWTPSRKHAIRDSRLVTTRRLIESLTDISPRPRVLVSASAIGYYGPRGDEPLEESSLSGQGFLARTCQEWESQAQQAESLGVHVVRLRIGVVLGPDGGALSKMLPMFRVGLGGPIGSGRQWMSWIHRDDIVGLIRWALARQQVSGAVNATAPEPVTMRVFAQTLGRAVRRPAVLPAPALMLRMLLGEMAEMLVTGQRVLPTVALAHGYSFQFPQLTQALVACVS